MAGFDANAVYSVQAHDAPPSISVDIPSEAEKLLVDFLLKFRIGEEFIYR